MEPMKLGELLKGVARTQKPESVIERVVTDSRKAGPGSVFVAIPGDRFDGNDYVREALDNGAEAAIVNRRASQRGEQIVVSNSRDALLGMAGNYRGRYNPKVAAVTGSVGKTTTKEMLAAVFGAFGETLKNEGNKNNEIGLPETVFLLTKQTQYAVFEMGMSGLGEIDKLARAASPSAAAITSIGVSHIESLGSRENILRAKLEIIGGMPQNGILAINGDDEMLMGARDGIQILTTTFAVANVDCEVTAKDIMTRGTVTEFTVSDRLNGNYRAVIPCSGNHNVSDALAAYTVATRMGLDPQKCADALIHYQAAGMRQKVVDFYGITVIEDCYNASPASMTAALETLAGLAIEGIRVAVLGDMYELGDIAVESHREVGRQAAQLGVDVLLCIGENMKHCVSAAQMAGISSAVHFEHLADIVYYLKRTVTKGDAVLFKGSRAMALENAISMFYGE